MSSWSNKLEVKLSKLADNASKESIQTLAKWMGFNRKRHVELSKGLINKLLNTEKTTRKWLYLQVANETLLLEKDNVDITKWDKLNELRNSLGEIVIIPAIKELLKRNVDDDNDSTTKLTEFVNEWDEKNVFGPTLLQQVWKAVKTPTVTSAGETSGTTIASSATNERKNGTDTIKQSEAEVGEEKESQLPKKDRESASPELQSQEHPKLSNDVASEEKKEAKADGASESDSAEFTAEIKIKTSEADSNEAKTSKIQAEQDKGKIEDDNKEVSHGEKPADGENDDRGEKETDSNSHGTKRPAPPERQTSMTSKDFEFDFEAEGIPYGKIDVGSGFLDPCKTIGTYQIARDLRSDSALQISSLINSVPDDVRNVCQSVYNQQSTLVDGEDIESTLISKDEAETMSLKLSEELIELDIEDALANVRTFREIVQKQRTAREELIHMLIKSRCHFGSDDAAAEYYKLGDLMELMNKRKELLSDAMDLEGLDSAQTEKEVMGTRDKKDNGNEDRDNLAPLSWYDPEKFKSMEEPDAKKARVS